MYLNNGQTRLKSRLIRSLKTTRDDSGFCTTLTAKSSTEHKYNIHNHCGGSICVVFTILIMSDVTKQLSCHTLKYNYVHFWKYFECSFAIVPEHQSANFAKMPFLPKLASFARTTVFQYRLSVCIFSMNVCRCWRLNDRGGFRGGVHRGVHPCWPWSTGVQGGCKKSVLL